MCAQCVFAHDPVDAAKLTDRANATCPGRSRDMRSLRAPSPVLSIARVRGRTSVAIQMMSKAYPTERTPVQVPLLARLAS